METRVGHESSASRRGVFIAVCRPFASASAIAQDVTPRNAPVHNIVPLHDAWADGSGWKTVYDTLTKDGYQVTIVQEPLTSLDDDVAATRRVLDQQNGPTILVAHGYGRSIITEAGVHPNVMGLLNVAAHAPAVGKNESDLGKGMPSHTSKQPGAVMKTTNGYTDLNPLISRRISQPICRSRKRRLNRMRKP